jgi:hypothetical protein
MCDTGVPDQTAQPLMDTAFLDRLATQLKVGKSAACRRAIERILVRMKEHCESGRYHSTTEAGNEFRRLLRNRPSLQVSRTPCPLSGNVLVLLFPTRRGDVPPLQSREHRGHRLLAGVCLRFGVPGT